MKREYEGRSGAYEGFVAFCASTTITLWILVVVYPSEDRYSEVS